MTARGNEMRSADDELARHLGELRVHREEVRDADGSVIDRVLSAGMVQVALELLHEKGIEIVAENGNPVCRGRRVPNAVRQFVKEESSAFLRDWGIKARQRRYSRGTGHVVPSQPLRPSDLPAQYRDTTKLVETIRKDVWSLHQLCADAIHRSLKLFGQVGGRDTRIDEPDSLTALADTITTVTETTARRATQIDRRMEQLRPAVQALVEDTRQGRDTGAHSYIGALLQETLRLVRGLAYAQTWLLLVRHQVLPMAAVLDLRRRDQVGRLEAVLNIANVAERKPWGEPEESTGLPTSDFPLVHYISTWKVATEEAVKAIIPTLMSKPQARKILPKILDYEAAKGDPGYESKYDAEGHRRDRPVGFYSMRQHTDAILGFQMFETVVEGPELRGMPWPEIYRRAATGKLSHLPQAIINDLFDWARKIQRRRKHEDILITLEADSDEAGPSSKTLRAEDVRLPEPPEGKEATRKPIKQRYKPDQADWHSAINGPDEEFEEVEPRLRADGIYPLFVDAHPEHLRGLRVLLSDEPREVLAKRERVTVKTLISWKNEAEATLIAWAKEQGYRQ